MEKICIQKLRIVKIYYLKYSLGVFLNFNVAFKQSRSSKSLSAFSLLDEMSFETFTSKGLRELGSALTDVFQVQGIQKESKYGMMASNP